MTVTDKHGNRLAEEVDPTLSGQYRRLADESVPGALDRAVLRTARNEARKNTTAGWQPAWFRPATTIAMIALSLALILEFNDANILTPPFLTGDQTLPLENPANVFRDAADVAAEQIREAEAAASSEMQNPGSDAESTVATDPVIGETTLLPVDLRCSADQRATMATWWQCIESLESRGASTAAERELRALVTAFPGFVEPD